MRPFRHSFQRLLRSPASGFRTTTTGDLSNVGTYGLCWSSSSSAAGNTNASALRFIPDEMDPFYSGNRAYGFTVRCVQHLQAAFFNE